MAQKVEILVTAKDAASQVMRGIASNFGEIGNAVQNLTSGAGIEYLTSQIIAFGKESVNATVAYADEVRKLSQITGASAEETSRLIQVADDFKVSTETLTAAQRSLAKDGITLTTESLAQLSDEYNRLAPGQERVTFLMDKFGRSGLRMAELMEQGGKSIRDMSEELSGGLVMTEKNVKAAREYEKALDNLNDKTEEVKVTIGNQLIPVLTALMSDARDDSIFQLGKEMGLTSQQAREFVRTIREIDAAPIDSATQSYMAMAQTLQSQVAPALEQVEIDTKAIDAANQQLFSTLSTVASEEQNYAAQMQSIQAERLATQQEIANTPAWDTVKIQEYTAKLVELDTKEKETTQSYKDGVNERIFALTQQRLAVDGLSDAETEYLLEVGQKMGIYSKEQVDNTKKQLDEAKKLADGFDEYQTQMTNAEAEKFATSGEQWRLYTENVGNQLDTNIGAIQDYINALTDIPADINTTISVTLPSGDLAAGQTSTQSGQTVNYYIQNAYIDSANGIQQVI